jgi:regulator of ribosome biosynthesis
LQQLGAAASIARASTASLGRFQPRLPQEKPSANVAKDLVAKKKKPNHTLYTAATERSAQLAIADSLLNKRPILDIEKAVNCQINMEQTE